MLTWIVRYYNCSVQTWTSNLPTGIRKTYVRLLNLLQNGEALRAPHTRGIGQGVFELRPQGKEGAARIFYCMPAENHLLILHGFQKKTNKTPKKELDLALSRMKEVKNGPKKSTGSP